MKIYLALIAFAACSVAFLSGFSSPEDAKKAEAVVAEQLPSYPLKTCLVSGLPLEKKGKPIDHVADGRLARFCCSGCIAAFDKDPAKYIEKIDAAVIADQGPRYPMTKCVVSSEKMGGEMGEPIDIVHGTRLVRLCCKMCKREFDRDPKTYMADVDKAWIRAQLPDYPLETCAVSGEKLGSMGEPIDMLYGTQLVRLCCKGCKRGMSKDPQKILATIAEAREAKAAAAKK